MANDQVILNALDRATEEIGAVRDELSTERRARKVSIIIGSIIMVFIIGMCVTLFNISSDIVANAKAQDIENCEQRNLSRSNTVEAFTFLIQASQQANADEDPPLTPEEQAEKQAQIDAFLTGLQERFPQVECE